MPRVRRVKGTNARPKVRTRGRFTPLSQQALAVPLEELGMLGSCGIMPRHELPKRAGGLLIEDRCGSCLRPVRTAVSGERRAAIALQKGQVPIRLSRGGGWFHVKHTPPRHEEIQTGVLSRLPSSLSRSPPRSKKHRRRPSKRVKKN